MGKSDKEASMTAPNRFVMSQVNTRNNIASQKLQRELTEIERQRDYSIGVIDRDRLDMHDFMKEVRKKESDKLPQNKTLLGRDLSKKQEALFHKRRRHRHHRRPDEEGGAEGGAAAYMEKPQHSDEPQRSRTARAARAARPADTGFSTARHTQSRAGLYKSVDRDSLNSSLSGMTMLSHVEPRLTASEVRAIIEQKFGKKKEEPTPLWGPVGEKEHGPPGDPRDNEMLMREVLEAKLNPRPRTMPLNERVKSFIQELDEVKKQRAEHEAEPMSFEMQRRYTYLTRGVHAALAMSREGSDEEDES